MATTKKAAKKKKRSEKVAEDRLEKVLREKQIDIVIDERKLTLYKWSLRDGMKLSGRIVDLIKNAMPSGQPVDLLKADIEDILTKYGDDFVLILSVSVARGNFESLEEATEWVEELAIEDAIELFTHIGRMNLRPLMTALRGMRSVVNGDLPKAGPLPAPE